MISLLVLIIIGIIYNFHAKTYIVFKKQNKNISRNNSHFFYCDFQR